MTTIAAVMQRSYTVDMFDDLEVPPHIRSFDKPSGVTTLTFAEDLTAEQVAAIRDRMTSKNDADQLARANLRALCAAAVEAEFDAEGFAAMKALALAAMGYWFGGIE